MHLLYRPPRWANVSLYKPEMISHITMHDLITKEQINQPMKKLRNVYQTSRWTVFRLGLHIPLSWNNVQMQTEIQSSKRNCHNHRASDFLFFLIFHFINFNQCRSNTYGIAQLHLCIRMTAYFWFRLFVAPYQGTLYVYQYIHKFRNNYMKPYHETILFFYRTWLEIGFLLTFDALTIILVAVALEFPLYT